MGAALIPAGISLGTTLLGSLFNKKSKQQQQAEDAVSSGENRYASMLGEGQDSLNTSIKGAMDSAMPSFRKAMQGTQETEIARGVGVGGLGTSYEGDLESAFQKNIANSAAGQAMNLYNTRLEGQNRYVDMLSGNRDYATAQANAQKKRRAGLFGAAGAAGGAIYGGGGGRGLPGAEMGADIGGMAGQAIGG